MNTVVARRLARKVRPAVWLARDERDRVIVATRTSHAAVRRRLVATARAQAPHHPLLARVMWRPTKRRWHALRERYGRAIRSSRAFGTPSTEIVRRCFDPDWYLGRYADARVSELDAYEHYRWVGVQTDRQPNAVFDVEGYRYDHPDVSDFGGDALAHYAYRGRHDGATPHPLFDGAWYRRRYHDVGKEDPYAHYLRVGRAERRATSLAVVEGMDIAEIKLALPTVGASDARVSIIVPTYGQYALTKRCLHALARNTPADLGFRVLLVDDRPEKPLRPLLTHVDGLESVSNVENLGYLRSCNMAADLATGEFLVVLNNDTVVHEGWLQALLEVASGDDRIAMVGCKLLDAGGTLQEAGVVMLRDAWGLPYGRGDHPNRPEYEYVRDVDAVSGACLLVRRAVFDAVGRFDETYAPSYFEEYDLAFKLRQSGYRVVYQPAARVLHYGGSTHGVVTRDSRTAANRRVFQQKWGDELSERDLGVGEMFLARERPHRQGSILVIEQRVPEPDRHAGGRAIYQYVELMLEAGLKVCYLPHDGMVRPPYTQRLQQMGVEVLCGIRPGEWFAANGRFIDRIWMARPSVAPRYLRLARSHSRARITYFTHDLHFVREQRRYELTGDPAARVEASRLRAIETAVLRAVDRTVTPSAAEVPLIRDMAPGADVHVVPLLFFGGDEGTASGRPLAERSDVLFVGGFEHLPNVDAARFLVEQVMPFVWQREPGTHVTLVGADPPSTVRSLVSERVAVTGHVPDTWPYYRSARMTVSPLRFGAGVKGKILESLAAGVPVITTSLGNEGIDLVDGQDALIANEPVEIGDRIVSLLRDPDLAEALATQGRQVIAQRYSKACVRNALMAAIGVTP